MRQFRGAKNDRRSERPAKAESKGVREPRRNNNGDRQDRRTAITFGVLPVLEALRANPRRVDKVFIADGVREGRLEDIISIARANNILVERISREDLNRFTGPDVNNQGVAIRKAPADYVDADAIFNAAADQPLILVLDGVEDPRNLGAILRTAECSGVDGVFIPERRAVGLTDVVAKASAGAVEHIKVAKIGNLNRLIEELKSQNIWVIGASGEAEMEYNEWDWTLPSALVLGSEGTGLHRLVAENCDALVKIPMYGNIESLNVSVASGVILFEARRQRSKTTKVLESDLSD